MNIKIKRMNMPPEGVDTIRKNKEAREGVVITALPGKIRPGKEDNEMTH